MANLPESASKNQRWWESAPIAEPDTVREAGAWWENAPIADDSDPFMNIKNAKPADATPRDYNKAFAASAYQAVGLIGQGIGEGLAYVANKVTGTQDYQGKNLLEGTATKIRKSMTPGGIAATEDVAKGDALSPSTWKLPETPEGLAMFVTQGFGPLSTWLIPGGAALRAAQLTRAGNTAKAASAAKAATVTGAVTGGLSAGGDAAGDARANVEKEMNGRSHEELLSIPVYAEEYKNSGDESQAKKAVANLAGQVSGLLAGTIGTGGGYVGGKLLGGLATKAGIPGIRNIPSTAGRVVAGGTVGAVGEGIQEGIEKTGVNIGENVALGRDVTHDITRNTFPEVLGGALVGAPLGAVGGGLSQPGQAKGNEWWKDAPIVEEEQQTPDEQDILNSIFGEDAAMAAEQEPVSGKVTPEASPEPFPSALPEVTTGARTQEEMLAGLRNQAADINYQDREAQRLQEAQAARDEAFKLADQQKRDEMLAVADAVSNQPEQPTALQLALEQAKLKTPPVTPPVITDNSVDDILRTDNTPFPTEKSALLAAQSRKIADVEPVNIGVNKWVLRKPTLSTNEQQVDNSNQDIVNQDTITPEQETELEALLRAELGGNTNIPAEKPIKQADISADISFPENYDKRLARTDYRQGLGALVADLTKGGGISLVPREGAVRRSETGNLTYDYDGTDLTRTPSLNPDWFQSMAANPETAVSVKDVKNAVTKAIQGKPLGVRQQRVISRMMDIISGEDRAQRIPEAKKALEKARAFRQRAMGAVTEDDMADMAGDRFKEIDYPIYWGEETRSLSELADEARDVDENRAIQILEKDMPDAQAALQLAQIIKEGKRRGQNQAARPNAENPTDIGQAPAGQAKNGEPGSSGRTLQGQATGEEINVPDDGQRSIVNPARDGEDNANRVPGRNRITGAAETSPAPVADSRADIPIANEPANVEPALEPWQLTKKEWDRQRENSRSETAQSKYTKGSSSVAVQRAGQLDHLLYGVNDDARQQLQAAQKGEVQLSQEEVNDLLDKINSPVTHRAVIDKAIKEGKPISPEVLADYPDISPKATPLTFIEQAARSQPSKDRFISYLRGRLGKTKMNAHADEIEQAWANRAAPKDATLPVKDGAPPQASAPQAQPDIDDISTSDSFNALPGYAQQAIGEHHMSSVTNARKHPGLINAEWEKVTVTVESLKDKNKLHFDAKKQSEYAGRKIYNSGPSVLDKNGELIDGNHRFNRAVRDGQKTIEVYRPKINTVLPGRVGAPPTAPQDQVMGDLLGQDTRKAQAIADAARDKDTKRNGTKDVPVESAEFFGQSGKLEPDLFESQQERRKDPASRKKIADMTDIEMRKALLIDDMTGLGNRRAYDESDKLPFQGSVDADALKWINDNMSPDSGDKLLSEIGAAINGETPNGYHISGDEFYIQGQSQEEIDDIMGRVQERLKSAVITVKKPDGTLVEKRGIEVTYGIGKDKRSADAALKQRKRDKEAEGLRAARGERPAGVVETPAQGKQDSGREAAGVAGQPLFSRDPIKTPVLSHDAVEAIAEGIFKKLGLGRNPSLATHENESTLPPEILAAAREQGAEGDISAVYWRNKVHVVSSKMGSTADVEKAIFHEAMGHYGARALFGKEWVVKANQLYLAMGGEKGVRDFTRKAGVNMDAYFESAQGMRDNTEKALYLVDELLAHMQGERAAFSLTQRVVDAVKALIGEARQWLSRNGFMELSRLTDYDLAVLLKKMRQSATKANDAAGKDGPMFMVAQATDVDDGDFASKALAYLAKNDELFRYPVSKQASLRGVMADIASDTRYVGNDTRHDERRESGADRRYMFETVDKKPFYVYERGVRDDAEIWIDVSRLSEGDQGGAIYAAMMNYAHNSGKVFIGDPAGLSEAAIVRRTSHMLSAALRYGKTDFMEPSPKQKKGIPEKGIAPLEWRGSDLDKLNSLINTFYTTIQSQNPEIKDYRYDFDREQFVDKTGGSVTGRRFMEGSQRGAARAARAGQATLRRAIFIQSLTSSPRGQRPQLLEQLIARSRALVTQGGLNAMFSRSPSAVSPPSIFAAQTVTAKVAASSSKAKEGIQGDHFFLPKETRRGKARRKIQDEAVRWEHVQEAILDQGGTITEESDVVTAIKQYPGKVAGRIQEFNRRIVEPLLENLAKAGLSMDDVGLYMYALHAKERNAAMAKINPRFPNDGKPGNSGSGMTDRQADQIIKGAKTHPDFAAIENAARTLRKVMDARLTMLVKEGVMSREQVNAYREQYENYVPLKGFEHLDETGVPQGAGRGMSSGKKIDYRALGRSSMAGDIVQNIIRDTGTAFMLAEKTSVGKAARNFIKANPDDKLWTVEKIPVDRVFRKGAEKHTIYQNGEAAGEFSDKAKADAYAKQMRAFFVGDDIIVKTWREPGSVTFKEAQFDPNEEIQFIEGGDVVRLQITDTLLTQAYNRLWNKGVSDGLKVLNSYNSWLRQMYTQKNPAWFIMNVFRDVQAIVPYLTGEKGFTFAMKALTNLPTAKRAAWNYYHKKPLGPVMDEVMKRYLAAGSSIGFAYVGDIEAKTQELEGLMHRYTGWKTTASHFKAGHIKRGAYDLLVKALNSKGFAWIEALNTSFENMSRLATFKAAIDSGMSDKEAAMLAKHVTVNFNTRGEWGPNMNAVWLFSNAGIQGTRGFGHALFYSKHKKQVWALSGGLMALGIMASMMGDDDDDLIDDADRGKSLTFKFGDTQFKWPMPYAWGAFGGIGQLIGQAIKHPEKQDELAVKLADVTMQHFSPWGNLFSDGEATLDNIVNITPTAAKPFFQAAFNKSSFGGPLYPENPYSTIQPDSEKAWMTTKGTGYDMIAKWINDVSGGDAVQEGGVSVSPETLKLGVLTLFGGVGRLAADLFALPSKVGSDELAPENIPIVKSFVGSINSDDYRSRFYEQSAKAKADYETYKGYQKRGDIDSTLAYRAEHQAMISLGYMAEGYTEQLKAIKEVEEATKADPRYTESERNLNLKVLDARKVELIKRYNDQFKGMQ